MTTITIKDSELSIEKTVESPELTELIELTKGLNEIIENGRKDPISMRKALDKKASLNEEIVKKFKLLVNVFTSKFL